MGAEGQTVLIAQMTDIHIGFDADAAGEELNQVRYRRTIERLLDQPNVPDMLVLTGDLTDRGDAASYARLAHALAGCPFPIFPLVGNHDSREAMLGAFPNCPTDDSFIHYAIELEGMRVLCLDTFEPGRHGGAFCERRAAWLAAQLGAHRGTPTLIFMHHPPLVSGIDWMDPRSDEDWIVNFGGAIAGHSQIMAIHCGHLHRPLQASFQGIPLGVTPSVAPAVALDLRAVDAALPDGRALITTEPAGYALHRWHDGSLVTHYETVGDWQTLAHYGPGLQPMMRDMFAERE